MFKNKAVQVTLVNTKKQEAETPAVEVLTANPEEIAKIISDVAVKTIGAIGIVFAANRVLSTACEIAVVVTKAKLK